MCQRTRNKSDLPKGLTQSSHIPKRILRRSIRPSLFIPSIPFAMGDSKSDSETLSLTLPALLAHHSTPPPLHKLTVAIASACADISDALRENVSTAPAGTHNPFGDAQLAVDLATDAIFLSALRAAGAATASSEEDPREIPLAPGGAFSVAYDPLDGSSIADCAWAVGTIFGVWPGARLLGARGSDLAAAGCAIYGPRTVLYLAVAGWSSVAELTLVAGAWVVTRRPGALGPGRRYAPANLRAAQDVEGYAALLAIWAEKRYTLRYSGGMVPDVVQMLVKGCGVFASPASASAPAKLRLLYEVLPMAFLVEAAGGASSDGREVSVLSRVVEALDERTPVCLGSKGEVARFVEYCPYEG